MIARTRLALGLVAGVLCLPSVGARAAEAVSLRQFGRTHHRLQRLLVFARDDAAVDSTIREFPCLQAFGQRHPGLRRVRGDVVLSVWIWNGVARIVAARAAGGNLDEGFAVCMRNAWRWTLREYPAPDSANALLDVAFGLSLTVRRSYPPLPPEWSDPAIWGLLSAQAATYPAGWGEVIEPVLWHAHRDADDERVRAPVSTVVRDPRALIRQFPVLVDELYDDVFSEAAAERYRRTACGPAGKTAVRTVVDLSDGEARVKDARLMSEPANENLLSCLMRKIGIARTTYLVPGEVDATLLIDWPVERAASSTGGPP